MPYISKVREESPLIFNIMNEIASNFSANGLIAIGASASIANMPNEAEEMASLSKAVVLNLGTLSEDRAKAMILAGKAANKAGVPVLLDPIAIGATTFRTDVIYDILGNVKLAAICGNAGEIAVLGDALVKTDSPDAAIEINDPEVAEKVAKKYDTVVIATGETDVSTTTLCKNGHYMLENITASGCVLTSVIAAFIGVADNDIYNASIEAVAGYTIAAELAMQKAEAPGTFIPAFLDQLYFLNEEIIDKHKKLEKRC